MTGLVPVAPSSSSRSLRMSSGRPRLSYSGDVGESPLAASLETAFLVTASCWAEVSSCSARA